MTETMHESRTISTIRTGTKVAVIVGLGLIGLAAYFYFTPVYLEKPEGGVFACGSPSAPNSEADNICGPPEGVSQARAFTALGLGIMVIVLGFALFGTGRARNLAGHLEGEDVDARSERAGRDGDRDHRDRSSGDRDGRGRGAGERDEELRGAPTRRSRREQREARERAEREDSSRHEEPQNRDGPSDELDDPPRSRSRRALRDDDFDAPSRSERRSDEEWFSDGWR